MFFWSTACITLALFLFAPRFVTAHNKTFNPDLDTKDFTEGRTQKINVVKITASLGSRFELTCPNYEFGTTENVRISISVCPTDPPYVLQYKRVNNTFTELVSNITSASEYNANVTFYQNGLARVSLTLTRAIVGIYRCDVYDSDGHRSVTKIVHVTPIIIIAPADRPGNSINQYVNCIVHGQTQLQNLSFKIIHRGDNWTVPAPGICERLSSSNPIFHVCKTSLTPDGQQCVLESPSCPDTGFPSPQLYLNTSGAISDRHIVRLRDHISITCDSWINTDDVAYIAWSKQACLSAPEEREVQRQSFLYLSPNIANHTEKVGKYIVRTVVMGSLIRTTLYVSKSDLYDLGTFMCTFTTHHQRAYVATTKVVPALSAEVYDNYGTRKQTLVCIVRSKPDVRSGSAFKVYELRDYDPDMVTFGSARIGYAGYKIPVHDTGDLECVFRIGQCTYNISGNNVEFRKGTFGKKTGSAQPYNSGNTVTIPEPLTKTWKSSWMTLLLLIIPAAMTARLIVHYCKTRAFSKTTLIEHMNE